MPGETRSVWFLVPPTVGISHHIGSWKGQSPFLEGCQAPSSEPLPRFLQGPCSTQAALHLHSVQWKPEIWSVIVLFSYELNYCNESYFKRLTSVLAAGETVGVASNKLRRWENIWEQTDLHCILETEIKNIAQAYEAESQWFLQKKIYINLRGSSFRQWQHRILQKVEKHRQPSCRVSENIWMWDVWIKRAPWVFRNQMF